MKIRPKVKSAVKELGYTKLRKGQSKVIDRILDRKDRSRQDLCAKLFAGSG